MGTGRITPYLYTQPEAWLAARAHENWPKWEQSRRKLLGLPAPVSPEPEKEESHELHDGAAHPSLQESGDAGNHFLHAAKYAGVTFEQAAAVACGLLQKGWRMSKSPEPPAGPAFEELPTYDAGLLNDFGGGNVGWWWDYIRDLLQDAHQFYQQEHERSTPIDLNATREEGENATGYVSVYEILGSKIDKLEEDLHKSKMECADLVSRTLMGEARLNEQLKGK